MLYKQKSRNRRLGTSRRPGWCEKGSPGSKARRKESCLKFLWTSAGFFKGPRSRGSTHPPCRSASGHLSLRRRLPVSPSGTLVGDWGPGHDDAPVVMTVGDVRPVARARQIVLGWGQSSKKISPPPPPTMMMMNRRDTDPKFEAREKGKTPAHQAIVFPFGPRANHANLPHTTPAAQRLELISSTCPRPRPPTQTQTSQEKPIRNPLARP